MSVVIFPSRDGERRQRVPVPMTDHDATLAADARTCGLRMQAHMQGGDREAARVWMDAMYAIQRLRARRAQEAQSAACRPAQG